MSVKDYTKEIQDLEYDALTTLRSFCQKNGIDFYLRGGSVMGAVKYNGFVPWDDDADIAVPRNQFNKLKELIRTEKWSDNYVIYDYKYNPEIHCYFPRILLKESIRIEKGLPKNNELGLTLVDILPLDGAPSNKLLRGLFYTKAYMLRALAGVWTLGNSDTVDMHDSKRRFVLRFLKVTRIHKLYKQTTIYDILDKMYQKNPYESSTFAGTITGSLYHREIFPKEIWGDGVEMKFRDTTFLVPDQYDSYLKKLYGENYLTTEPNDAEKYFKQHIK